MVKKILAKCYIYILMIIMYAPILLLVVYSFQNKQTINLNELSEFSLQLYFDLFKNQEILDAVFNTIIIAITSAAVATILGTCGAIGIFYGRKRIKDATNMVSQIPVLNAEIVTALSLIIFFTAISIQKSFFTLLVGHVVLTVPFVVLSIIPKLKQMDPNIYEAALDLGCTPARALYKVVLPEIIPGIFSGFMLAITLSLDDYIITAFTRNITYNTLSTYVYGVTAKGPLPPALRALTTIIFVGMLIGIIIYNIIVSRKIKARDKKLRKRGA